MQSRMTSSRLCDGIGGIEAAAAGFSEHAGDTLGWVGTCAAGSVDSVAAAAEALASAPAGDCGPLDDLLLAVDRMLRHVERAMD